MSRVTYNETIDTDDAIHYASLGLLDVPEKDWPKFLQRITDHLQEIRAEEIVELREGTEECIREEAYNEGYGIGYDIGYDDALDGP